jgi:diguanylate cyclase (GGDEF)-like protein
MIVFTCSLIALFIVYLIYEHSAQLQIMHVLFALNIILNICFLVLVIVNLFNGCLFYFEDGLYCRGPLNQVGYILFTLYMFLIVIYFYSNRKTASKPLIRMMQIIPWVAVAIVLFQMMYPDIIMNGLLLSFANLIIFISFQNSLIGVDALTGLGDRSAFMERLSKFTRTQKRFHVILISIRRFEQVNLNYGHLVGDGFLYAIASFLNTLPSCSMAYRLGNVNFAIICSKNDCDKVGHCIKVIQERFQSSWHSGEHSCLLSACYSDILWEGQHWNSSQILERLEYAMKIAKARGENEHLHFDETTNRMMERQNYVIEQIRTAIAHKSFEIFYQPVYNWQDDQFYSAEALVRLVDENGMTISPSEFIPIAEESLMIHDISWIIIEKVCAFLAAHPELPLKAISVNLSSQQFMDNDMQAHLESIFEQYGISHHQIKLEITERTICENLSKAERIMKDLSEKGIGFYLDDFGTGYSNFASVLTLPFETVKLDKSLTDKISSTEKDQQLVTSIVNMFLNAGYSLVAEGAQKDGGPADPGLLLCSPTA